MKTTSGKAAQATTTIEGLSQLKRRFEQWRAGRRVGERIPPQLWNDAVDAIAGHGAYRVARELNLDYAMLKRRAAPADGDSSSATAPSGALAPPRFVELFAPAAAMLPAQGCQPTCVVEMVDARGAKMRVELRGDGLAGLPALCNAFLGAR